MAIEFLTTQTETKQKVLDFVEEWNNSSDYIMVRTSGSTGKPKEIRLLKEHMTASAKATGEFLQLKNGDTTLLCLSMETIGGRMMVVRSMVLKLNLIVTDVSSTPLAGIDRKIDFAAMVPMQVQKSIEHKADDVNNIQKLIVGGGPVSNELIDRIQSTATQVYHTFGMTETISHIAMRQLNHPLHETFNCLPNVTITNRNGSLCITAPDIGVFELKTNDEVEVLSNQSFKWLGRTDFVINSGGIKLHPEVIEQSLTQFIQVPFFVYGEADDLLGERLILALESPVNMGITKKDLHELLSKHEVPKEIRYIQQFEYTSSGKINRLVSKKLSNVAREVL